MWEDKVTIRRASAFASLLAAAAFCGTAFAEDVAPPVTAQDYAGLEATQNAANATPGPRRVPERSIPVPKTASPNLQAAIAAPYRMPAWNANPKSPAEWKELINKLAAAAAAAQTGIRDKLGVTLETSVMGGVKVFVLTPKEIAPENRNRLL